MNAFVMFLVGLVRPFIWQIIAGIMAVAALAGVYAYIRHQGVVAEQQKQAAREIAAYREQVESYKAGVEQANKMAKTLEAQLAEAAIKQQQLNERLRHELANNGIYRQCRVPSDGVRILRDARAGRAATR